MTFTEAAAQVLRLVGKPLHYKEITDVAIEKNLLSHVGKSPEVTMGARLAALVKKSDKDNPLVRVKPGVFALREWDSEMVARGLADRTPALERLAAAMAAAGEVLVDIDEDNTDPTNGAGVNEPAGDEPDDDEVLIGNEDDRRRAELAAGATDLFKAEDDDDQPIFGAADEAKEEDDDGDPGGRRRRRHRKRGRGGEDVRGGDDLPSYTISDPSTEQLKVADAEARAREARPADVSRDRPERDRPERERPDASRDRSDRSDRDRPERDRPERDRPERDRTEASRDRSDRSDRDRPERDRPERDRSDRDRTEARATESGRDESGRNSLVAANGRNDRNDRGDASGGPDRGRVQPAAAALDELVGRDLADAIAQLLSSYDRSAGPVPFNRLAEAAKRRGRLALDIAQGTVLLEAAARADNLRRQSLGQRPRFRLGDHRIASSDWGIDGELLRIERDLYALVERYREQSKRALLRRLQELPQRSFGELVLLLLERIGFTELSPARRPGTHGAELHLSGKLQGSAGEIRVAIVLRRDGREIGRERVTELRGALHHYAAANAGWLITAGQVLSGAKEEANAPGAAPVNLLDGVALVRLMEEQGIGTNKISISVPVADIELFDALRAGG